MSMKDINDNIITNRWEARYEKLSDDKKRRLTIYIMPNLQNINCK